MMKVLKIACLALVMASIWFTFSFRGHRATLKIGTWESRPLLLTDMSSEDDSSAGDSDETDFG